MLGEFLRRLQLVEADLLQMWFTSTVLNVEASFSTRQQLASLSFCFYVLTVKLAPPCFIQRLFPYLKSQDNVNI